MLKTSQLLEFLRLFKSDPAVKILKKLWLVLILIALIYFIHRHLGSYWNYASKLRLSEVIIGVFTAIVAKVLLSRQMRMSLACFNKEVSVEDGVYFYSISDISKYIPGGIWAVATRGVMYKRLGLSVRDISKALLLEYLWLLGPASFVGCISYFIAVCYIKFVNVLSLNFISYSLAGVLLLSIAWYSCVQIAHKIIIRRTLPLKIVNIIFIQQFIIWPLFGISLFILLPRGYEHWFYDLMSIGALALGKFLGIIAIFAPGGLGMREGTVIFLLHSFIPLSVVIFISITNRILLVMADILLAVFSVIFIKPKYLNKRGKSD